MAKKKKRADKAVRMTITIPGALRARMLKAERKGEFNWSATAAEAFERELEHKAKDSKPTSLEEVATRLRASKRERVDAVYSQGWQDGYRWAREMAEVDHLARLAELTAADRRCLAKSSQPAHVLGMKIDPEQFDCVEAATSFWADFPEAVEGNHLINPAYAEGFVDAARDLWSKVKDQVGWEGI